MLGWHYRLKGHEFEKLRELVMPPRLCFPVPEVPAAALLGLESGSTHHLAQGRDWEGQG